jgi:hypothetical protein
VTLLGRDVVEVDALVTDRYLDSLLAGREPGAASDAPKAGSAPASVLRRSTQGPTGLLRRGPATDRLDRGVRLASERLALDLPRFHPSFRFEERLAVRLAEAAAAMRMPAAAGAEGSMGTIPFPAPELPPGFDPLALDPRDGDEIPITLPLLIRGAVAASALSLAGAAWVAWRRGHASGSPMARAARAVHAVRGRPA